jgi:protein-tyrosine phosphatase
MVHCKETVTSLSNVVTTIFAGMRILMVCLGNICRSPLAEGILQHKAWKAGLNWSVESAGTGAWHVGEPPHHLSIKVGKQNGIDISRQRVRQFCGADFKQYDFIYVMDSNNYVDAKHIAGKLFDETKIDLLLNELYPGENRAVPDPWFGNEDGYHEVFGMLDKACERIIQKYSVSSTNETNNKL